MRNNFGILLIFNFIAHKCIGDKELQTEINEKY